MGRRKRPRIQTEEIPASVGTSSGGGGISCGSSGGDRSRASTSTTTSSASRWPSTHELFVTAVLPSSAGAEAALAGERLYRLRHASGIETVEVAPTLDRSLTRVRIGPFVLRRRGTAAQGTLPPTLLYCFACLAMESGKEPEVTLDVCKACIAFLEYVLQQLNPAQQAGDDGDDSTAAKRAAVVDAIDTARAMLPGGSKEDPPVFSVASTAELPPEHQASVAYLLPHLDPSHTRLLDIGCGPGIVTAVLAARAAHVTAIDTVQVRVAETSEHVAAVGLSNVSVQVASVYALPYAAESFDVVHAHQVLAFLPDPVCALKEMRR